MLLKGCTPRTLKRLVSLALLFMCYWCTESSVISLGAMQRTAVLATAKQKAQRFGMVMLLYLNDAYYATTQSFLCNLSAINSTYFDTLLIVTASSHTASKLKRAFPKISVQTITFSENQALGFNDFAYYKLTAERLRIQNILIQSGLTVFTVESDATWFATDIVEIVSRALEHHNVVSADDFFNLRNEHRRTISAGFMAYKSTKYTRRLFSKYTKQYMSYIQGVNPNRKDEIVEGEQILLTKLLDKEESKTPRQIDVLWLDGCEFVNGQWYSDAEYRSACRQPIVVQNNWIIGIDEKVSRAKKEHHWFLNEHANDCAIPVHFSSYIHQTLE